MAASLYPTRQWSLEDGAAVVDVTARVVQGPEPAAAPGEQPGGDGARKRDTTRNDPHDPRR
jgi:hypothetical protein